MYKNYSKLGKALSLIYLLPATAVYLVVLAGAQGDWFKGVLLLPFILPWVLIFKTDGNLLIVLSILTNYIILYLLGFIISYLWSKIFKK